MNLNINTRIAGSYFCGSEVLQLLKELPKNTSLRLEPEPDNEFDPNAIKVMLDNYIYESEFEDLCEDVSEPIKLGYVAKDINERVLQKINEGAELTINYKGSQLINIKDSNTPDVTVFGKVF